jgi:hypothetical protein
MSVLTPETPANPPQEKTKDLRTAPAAIRPNHIPSGQTALQQKPKPIGPPVYRPQQAALFAQPKSALRPSIYRPAQTASGKAVLQQKPKLIGPPVYKPQQGALSAQSKKSTESVYRPVRASFDPGVLQRKPALIGPPVYRPNNALRPVQRAVEGSNAAPFSRTNPGAPPVYHPEARSLQSKSTMQHQAPKAAPPVYHPGPASNAQPTVAAKALGAAVTKAPSVYRPTAEPMAVQRSSAAQIAPPAPQSRSIQRWVRPLGPPIVAPAAQRAIQCALNKAVKNYIAKRGLELSQKDDEPLIAELKIVSNKVDQSDIAAIRSLIEDAIAEAESSDDEGSGNELPRIVVKRPAHPVYGDLGSFGDEGYITGDEDDDDRPDEITFYHATTVETGNKFIKDARLDETKGKGEYGAGFYCTRDYDLAEEIARYYQKKDVTKSGVDWCILSFDISPTEFKGCTYVEMNCLPNNFPYIEKDFNQITTGVDLMRGPIKDNATQGRQYKFEGAALGVLSQHATRKMVRKLPYL